MYKHEFYKLWKMMISSASYRICCQWLECESFMNHMLGRQIGILEYYVTQFSINISVFIAAASWTTVSVFSVELWILENLSHLLLIMLISTSINLISFINSNFYCNLGQHWQIVPWGYRGTGAERGGGGYLLSYIQRTMGVPLGVRHYNINLGTLAIIEILYQIFNNMMI